jgi:DNA-binding transcriptional LysR family regulator
VSNAIRRLEATLGTPLIDRRDRAFALTSAGSDLLRYARDVIASINRIGEGVPPQEVSGRIALHMASYVVSDKLDRVLREALISHPALRLTVTINSSTEVIRSVAAKQASFGICLTASDSRGLASQVFYRQHFGLYCGPDHPLFGRAGLKPEDLRGETFVSFQTDTLLDALQVVARFRARHGIDENVVATSPYLEEVRRLIRLGVGVGPLPTQVAQADIDAGRLFRLPPHDASLDVPVLLYWHSDLIRNGAEEWMLTRLRAD